MDNDWSIGPYHDTRSQGSYDFILGPILTLLKTYSEAVGPYVWTKVKCPNPLLSSTVPLDHWTIGPVLGPLESKFGHLWSDKVVRVVSPNAPYPVPTLFHLVPTIFWHQRPFRPNSSHIHPFGPILGPPRVQILAIYGVTKWSEWSVLMPPILFQPRSTLFQPFWTILTS